MILGSFICNESEYTHALSSASACWLVDAAILQYDAIFLVSSTSGMGCDGFAGFGELFAASAGEIDGTGPTAAMAALDEAGEGTPLSTFVSAAGGKVSVFAGTAAIARADGSKSLIPFSGTSRVPTFLIP